MYRDKTFARPKNKSLYSCHFLLHKFVDTTNLTKMCINKIVKIHENARPTFYKSRKGLFLLMYIFVKYCSRSKPAIFEIWKSNTSAEKYVLKEKRNL